MSVAAEEANVLHPDGGAGRKLLSVSLEGQLGKQESGG